MYEHHPTICDFRLTKLRKQRLTQVLKKKLRNNMLLRLRQLRNRKQRVAPKASTRRLDND